MFSHAGHGGGAEREYRGLAPAPCLRSSGRSHSDLVEPFGPAAKEIGAQPLGGVAHRLGGYHLADLLAATTLADVRHRRSPKPWVPHGLSQGLCWGG